MLNILHCQNSQTSRSTNARYFLAIFSVLCFTNTAQAQLASGPGLGNSVCGASPATSPYQDIGLRWEYNDWGGWNPNASIDQTNIIASATPASFNNIAGAVNSYDLNLNADQIPASYDPNTYFEYQFTTANFADNAEITGAGFTLFNKAQASHYQATGAYHVAIQIDDDPAFGSPDTWFSDLAFNNGDVSAASASTTPNNTGNYVQTFAHFDPNGSTITLSPNTSYKMRIFPFDVTEYGDDNNQPYTNIVLWDDFMPKILSCSNPVAPENDMATVTGGMALTPIQNVAANDMISGNSVDLSAGSANATVSESGVWPSGFSLNSDGSVAMQSSVSSGFYSMDYELCDLSSPAQCSTATIEITVEAPAAPPAFPDGPGLGASVCEVTSPSHPWADIGFRWLYNDNGGTSPNISIDNSNVIASGTAASFSGLSAQVNNYDLNINADQIPDSFDPSVYMEYQFTTANFSDQAELVGAGWTVFGHQNSSDQQATGAYRVAILVDDDTDFSSPTVWYSDLQFDGADVSSAAASNGESYSGTYLQNFAHWNPDGSTVELSPSTTYKVRVYPYNVTAYGDDNGQPYTNIVLWDDFTPKVASCDSVQTASVSGSVFKDDNGDGVYNSNETDFSALTINAYLAGPDALFGTADDVLAGTGETGSPYDITLSDPGDYQLRLDTTDPDMPSDLESSGSPTLDVTVAAGDAKTDLDFPLVSKTIAPLPPELPQLLPDACHAIEAESYLLDGLGIGGEQNYQLASGSSTHDPDVFFGVSGTEVGYVKNADGSVSYYFDGEASAEATTSQVGSLSLRNTSSVTGNADDQTDAAEFWRVVTRFDGVPGQAYNFNLDNGNAHEFIHYWAEDSAGNVIDTSLGKPNTANGWTYGTGAAASTSGPNPITASATTPISYTIPASSTDGIVYVHALVLDPQVGWGALEFSGAPECPAPELSMTKTADNEGPFTAGDVVTYTYRVTNEGNQIVRNVAVTDTHNGSDPAPVPGDETLLTDVAPMGDSTDGASDGNWDVLAPGDTLSFTGSYTVTEADAENL